MDNRLENVCIFGWLEVLGGFGEGGKDGWGGGLLLHCFLKYFPVTEQVL